jgi:hypothetical protein
MLKVQYSNLYYDICNKDYFVTKHLEGNSVENAVPA